MLCVFFGVFLHLNLLSQREFFGSLLLRLLLHLHVLDLLLQLLHPLPPVLLSAGWGGGGGGGKYQWIDSIWGCVEVGGRRGDRWHYNMYVSQ